MSTSADWSYVQARIQARHGERLDEAAWRALDAGGTFEQYLDRVRATALRRFAGAVTPGLSSHALERDLRLAWQRYVAELATWVPAAWKAAVLWTSHVPDLPIVERLLAAPAPAPAWIAEDARYSPFRDGDPQRRAAALALSPIAALTSTAPAGATVGERWLAHWRALWPRHGGADRASLDRLIDAVAAHFARLARAGARETSAPYRREIARGLTRLFRAGRSSPMAVFAHLALVGLDLERLRGGLVRRRLFGAARPELAP